MTKIRSICIEFIQNVMKTSVAARKEDSLTATIIVTKAKEMLDEIHDRMPVILDPDDLKPWVNGALGSELLEPALDDNRSLLQSSFHRYRHRVEHDCLGYDIR